MPVRVEKQAIKLNECSAKLDDRMKMGKKLLIGTETKTSNRPHTYLLDIYRFFNLPRD